MHGLTIICRDSSILRELKKFYGTSLKTSSFQRDFKNSIFSKSMLNVAPNKQLLFLVVASMFPPVFKVYRMSSGHEAM